MKALKLLFCFLSFTFSLSFSYGQNWDWARDGYGTSMKTDAYGSSLVTDNKGDVYLTGNFSNTIVFTPYSLTSIGEEAYLIKYDSVGTIIWVVSAADSFPSQSEGSSVATDAWGNVYVTGGFYGATTFGSITLRAKNNGYATFLIKYNSAGNVLWAKQSVPHYFNNFNSSYSVATDKFSNVFITGYFEDTVSFGPDTMINPAVTTFCIIKYDSAGNVLWTNFAHRPNAGHYSTYTTYGCSVECDAIGNAYVLGLFCDTLCFNTDTLIGSPVGSTSAFLVKYSSLGSFVWAKQSRGTSVNSSVYASSLTLDMADNIYITGYFSDTVKFGYQTLYSPTYTSWMTFLSKYDSAGNVLWAKQSSVGWVGSTVSSDELNNIYLEGSSDYYYTNADTFKFGNYKMQPSPSVVNSTYLIKLDTSGNVLYGSIVNNLGVDLGATRGGVASDSSGQYVYLAGCFQNDTIICAGDTFPPPGGSDEDIFIARWGYVKSTSNGVVTIKSSTPSISLFPNPNNGIFTLRANGQQILVNSNIEIYNMLEEKVYFHYQITNLSNYQIDLSGQPAGVYLYRIVSENGALLGDGKFVIQK